MRDGQFHHLAVTVDRDGSDRGRLYVDGEVVLVFDPTTEPGDLRTDQALRIGPIATEGPAYDDTDFNGMVDKVLYFYQLEAGALRQVKKMALVK